MEEKFILGFENKKERDENYFKKLFESYGYRTESIKILVVNQSIINLLVKFNSKISIENSTLNLPGFGEFELTNSTERVKQFSQEKEIELSFPFFK